MDERAGQGSAEASLATNWHRLFGLLLTDFFTDSPFVVELEKDLSQQKQLLDVVILRRGQGHFTERLPDGLDNLAAHNLITFKSHREALDDWALKELTGHYVNYRKQAGPPRQALLPEDEFRLYAVCSRYPHNLASQVAWQHLQEGVYETRRGTDAIRVIVLTQLPQQEHNAMLHLFSASREQVSYGAAHYRQRSANTSTLLDRLVVDYVREGVVMPYTIEDLRREYARERFKELSTQERLEALRTLTKKERLELLEGFRTEEIEKSLQRREKGAPAGKRKKKP